MIDEESINASLPEGVVMLRVGNGRAPYKFVTNCNTCQSPHRAYIEEQLAKGIAIATIVREVSDLDHGEQRSAPSWESVKNHLAKSHMPLDLARTRGVMEDRAREVGQAISDEVDIHVDYVAANRLIVQKGIDRIVTGEIQPDVKDVLSATRALADIDRQMGDTGLDIAVLYEALDVLLQTTAAFMPIDVRQEWGNAIATNPVLAALREKAQAKDVEERTIAGEIA